ncbi:MAG: ferrous iron transport protein B [Paludibacteraceae bacterium]|nr:ferrous iron transport protein B [Paludibacteraceae bacterium]
MQSNEPVTTLTLDQIKAGERCIIVKLTGHGGFRHRLLEMGFVRGQTVNVIKNAPLQDPVEYEVMGCHVSLRRAEAKSIQVVSMQEDAHPDNLYHGTIEEHIRHEVDVLHHEITVALVGNPNCGKTSFFNYATGLREKVGNYSGVTVDAKIGIFRHRGYTINLVDLPGTYSLTDFSPEELYVRDFLTNQHPDLVLNIVDAGNLERNLLLTTQLIDQNLSIVMALNMYDELEDKGDQLDVKALSSMLGFQIVPTVARTGQGIQDVLEAIVSTYEHPEGNRKHIHINYGSDMERAIQIVRQPLDQNPEVSTAYHSRYAALKLIENDRLMHERMCQLPNYDDIRHLADEQQKHLERIYGQDIQSVVSDLKYGFIRGALNETLTHGKSEKKRLAYALDTILTHRWLGFPVLIAFLWIMFQATFTLGAYPQAWIESGVDMLNNWLKDVMQPGMFTDMLTDGIISGIGGVLVFLPNILILYLFISILEDTGYMARAAFLMDKLMHRIGLHGKSFIPYIIGFGCGVPAIMATRTLENRKDRILTIITIPFMSCSARLPVYLLFVGALFERNQGAVLLSLYLIGILFAIITAFILDKVKFKRATDTFVMELPPYRIPTVRNTLIHMWDKSVQYLQKMGTVILFASIIIWALGYFPRPDKNLESTQTPPPSYIQQIGHAVEPVVRPLGFDWRMGVSLLVGLSAKETVVSTLGVLYVNQDDLDEQSATLKEHVQTLTDADGKRFFTPLRAYTFLLFILLYVPCIAAVTAIRREAGRGWMWFSVVYNIGLAWMVCFAVWQIGCLL